MIDRIDQQLKVQRVALGVLTHRQELLASNIANADTPHFKARDIDFKDALGSALAGRRSADVGMMATSPRHLGGTSGSSFAGAAKYRTEFQPSVDGNTVNMDVERSAFAQNALRLEAALTFINSDFKSLQMAMSQ
ncbi:MAG: flagellar basal body rod protein FlgB [Sulfuritalea sp.]|jgi:flagellar basal-body rod protein FlgB|nr:flagellar basal body rod protein FlgB [Azonexus sp.]MCC7310399.1 flagellar basal body rod protein FlgB [Sulfuritalea sp.]